MNVRWPVVNVCVVLALVLLGVGLLVPVHLRAVDAGVLLSAGRAGDSVLKRGDALMNLGRLGAAQMLAEAAHQAAMPGWDRLAAAVTNGTTQNSAALFWGNDVPARAVFTLSGQEQAQLEGGSFSAFIVQRHYCEAALAHLEKTPSAAARAVLNCRDLTHTVLLPSSSSASGQAFDAVVAECGLLLEGNHLTTSLSDFVQDQARLASRGGSCKR